MSLRRKVWSLISAQSGCWVCNHLCVKPLIIFWGLWCSSSFHGCNCTSCAIITRRSTYATRAHSRCSIPTCSWRSRLPLKSWRENGTCWRWQQLCYQYPSLTSDCNFICSISVVEVIWRRCVVILEAWLKNLFIDSDFGLPLSDCFKKIAFTNFP